MAIPKQIHFNINELYWNTTLKLLAQNSNIVYESNNAKILTDLFQKTLKECIENLGEQKSMLRTYWERMKLNRYEKFLRFKKMIPG